MSSLTLQILHILIFAVWGWFVVWALFGMEDCE